MTRKTEADSAKSELLIAIARDLIRESGDFELSMRELAARAQVSLLLGRNGAACCSGRTSVSGTAD